MADASPVTFQTETPAKAKAAAAKLVADEAALKAANPAPQADPEAPKSGDTFAPVRGKVGVWQSLGGDAAGILVPIITH